MVRLTPRILFSRPDHMLAPRSRLPSRPLVPYEPHAARCRGVYLARSLFRSHHDGRAYRRTSLERGQRPSRPCDGEPHAFTHLIWSGICHSAPFILALVEGLTPCCTRREMNGSNPSFRRGHLILIISIVWSQKSCQCRAGQSAAVIDW
jgi:hypothetical protein